jgi:RNA polymerase sigma factor (sigma-70 family)
MPQPTREVWERLYKEEFPHVYRALVVVLRDRELALDVLQDAFTEGLRRPPPGDENLPGWLFRVALRRARRSLRHAAAHTLRAVFASSDRDELALALDRAEVGRLLAMISSRQRAMVIAEYYLDLDQEEMARIFGVRRGTVAATLAQARARMRTGGKDVSR